MENCFYDLYNIGGITLTKKEENDIENNEDLIKIIQCRKETEGIKNSKEKIQAFSKCIMLNLAKKETESFKECWIVNKNAQIKCINFYNNLINRLTIKRDLIFDKFQNEKL